MTTGLQRKILSQLASQIAFFSKLYNVLRFLNTFDNILQVSFMHS